MASPALNRHGWHSNRQRWPFSRRERVFAAALALSAALVGFDQFQMQAAVAARDQATQALAAARNRQRQQFEALTRQQQELAFLQRLDAQGAFAADHSPPTARDFPGETLALDWQPAEENRVGPYLLRRQLGRWLFTARHEVHALSLLAKVRQAWPERLRWLGLRLDRNEQGLWVAVEMEWRSSPGPAP